MDAEVLAKADKIVEKARVALYEGGPRGSSSAYLFCGSYEPLDRKLLLYGDHIDDVRNFLRKSAQSGQLKAILIVADVEVIAKGKDPNEEESFQDRLKNTLLSILHTPTETLTRRQAFVETNGQRVFSDAGWIKTEDSGGFLANPWWPQKEIHEEEKH